MLEINNYNSDILKDITFSLKEGENLIILGKNGAGKSTLFNLIACSLPLDSGKIIFAEQEIQNHKNQKRITGRMKDSKVLQLLRNN